jgi:hypothetical protein
MFDDILGQPKHNFIIKLLNDYLNTYWDHADFQHVWLRTPYDISYRIYNMLSAYITYKRNKDFIVDIIDDIIISLFDPKYSNMTKEFMLKTDSDIGIKFYIVLENFMEVKRYV